MRHQSLALISSDCLIVSNLHKLSLPNDQECSDKVFGGWIHELRIPTAEQ